MVRNIALLVIVLVVTACSAPVKESPHSGYLSNYSKLKESEKEKNYLSYRSDKLKNYTKYIIDPVAMVYQQKTKDPDFSEEELLDLQTYLRDNIIKALTSGDHPLTIVDDAGKDVARIKVAITDVKKTIGALNLTIYTKVTGVGLGGVAVEGELVDSLTGEQIAAAVHWGSGSRVLRAGYTKTGDAKILLKKWSKELKIKLSNSDENES